MNKKSVVIIVIIVIAALLFLFMKYAEKKASSDFKELADSGVEEQLDVVWNSLQEYKTVHGQCPENLEDLYPDYISSTDMLLYGEDKKAFNYDSNNCDISYSSSFGVGF